MDHHLLEKYFNGTCTAEERTAVEQWLENPEELPTLPLDERDLIRQERSLSAVNEKISRYQNIKVRRKWQLAVAACVLTTSALAVLFHLSQLKNRDHLDNQIAWRTTAIPMGQKAKVTLADGSTIELNGGSSISYPERFTGQRTVNLLRGDAFFSVTKDAKHPFIVETGGNSRIKVLGTHFNVKHNRYTSTMEITLNSGKILFERKGKQAQVLLPGQQLQYLTASNTISMPMTVDTTATDAWRKNILLFKNTPIRQVLNELEQFYGVTIKNPGAADSQLLSAQFENEPLSRVLTLIGKSTKLTFSQRGKTIYIHP